MGQTTFSGPVRCSNGFLTYGIDANRTFPVEYITGTTTLLPENAGKLHVVFIPSGTITLPEINFQDTTAQGESLANLEFLLFMEVPSAAPNLLIKCGANGTFFGGVYTGVNNDAGKTFTAGAANNTMTFNGTTTGGIAGSFIKLRASGNFLVPTQDRWIVTGTNLLGSGVLISPFSTT